MSLLATVIAMMYCMLTFFSQMLLGQQQGKKIRGGLLRVGLSRKHVPVNKKNKTL